MLGDLSFSSLCTRIMWFMLAQQARHKLVYTQRFPAKTENKYTRNCKHQVWICYGNVNMNTVFFNLEKLNYSWNQLLSSSQLHSNNPFSIENIIKVHCQCTFKLLSADTTISSDFLQVYYKSLERTSTAAAIMDYPPL